MKLKITFDNGGVEEVAVLPGDIVRFEREYGISSQQADENPRVEHALYLAHRALVRTKRTDSEFDNWIDTVADVDPVEEEVPLDRPDD
jgi:hypothetical protein